jgi:F0F1-type ATP synthase assembly protein I
MGVSNTKFRRPAMYCLVVFMLGLAFGRILSVVVDGIAHWLLIVYLVLELTIGLIGLNLIRKADKTE